MIHFRSSPTSDTKRLFDKLGRDRAVALLTSADGGPASLTVWENWRLLSVALAADGRGQWRLRADETGQLPDGCYGECIVERGIHFFRRSVVESALALTAVPCFALTHNLHPGRHLAADQRRVPQANAEQQEQAESMLSAIMQALNYVGANGDGMFSSSITPEGLKQSNWRRAYITDTGRKMAPASVG